jgi:glycine cleavage system H protein
LLLGVFFCFCSLPINFQIIKEKNMDFKIPADLRYTKKDEWVRVEDGEAVLGITDYAQDALSDIVYLELPGVGDALNAGEPFGTVESVKAASEIYTPVGGEVLAVNDELVDAPEKINHDPYGSWMIRIRMSDPAPLAALMDATAYDAYLKSRE